MINLQLASLIKDFVTRFFTDHHVPVLRYHNLNHTKEVVLRSAEIADHCSLDETELFVLTAAAWFHDCGYLTGPPNEHEARGIRIMNTFMNEHGIEKNIIAEIKACIDSTKYPTNPVSLTAKILCDADSYHFGTDHLFVSDEQVKEEFSLSHGFIPLDWDKKTVQLLEQHNYYTDYCRQLLEPGKQKNIYILRQRISTL